ncbi:MAG: hypothetical protein JWR89_1604 [Tardiphaga sp.]|jgi:hypothetical protein|uniref:hypothetical protein n=1 Tax=Tardiphaga sp. TaxID=1926292 RepID=UPI002605EA72|nr:hypothetical protein [Tardiphaga sp.]MDB5501702.1 hypothetical protein [Tardiphaga sp.]
MWKSTITVVLATIGVFAIVLTATAMLIDASAVEPSAIRNHSVPGSCRPHPKVNTGKRIQNFRLVSDALK